MTHHFKTLADVVQSGMRFVVVRGLKAGAVVLDDDLDRRIRIRGIKPLLWR